MSQPFGQPLNPMWFSTDEIDVSQLSAATESTTTDAPQASGGSQTSPSTSMSSPPSSSSLSLGDSAKRRYRRTQACDDCRRRKVRCDGQRPSCSSCRRHGVLCHYQEIVKKRGPKPGYIEKLERRLNMMERMLLPLASGGEASPMLNSPANSPQIQPHTSIPSGFSQPSPLNRTPPTSNIDWLFRLSNTMPGSNTSFMATTMAQPVPVSVTQSIAQPFTQPIVQPVAQPMSLPGTATMSATATNVAAAAAAAVAAADSLGPITGQPFASFGSNPASTVTSESPFNDLAGLPFNTTTPATSMTSMTPSSISNTSPLTALNSFPDMALDIQGPDTTPPELRDHLIDSFFSSMNIFVPVVHENTFLKQVRENTAAPMLVYCMMAIGVRFSPLPEVRNDPTLCGGMVYIQRSKALLKRAIVTPNQTSVTALFLISVYMFACGDLAKSWISHGASLRMAQTISLHIIDDYSDPITRLPEDQVHSQVVETKRRLWWSLFLIDRYSGVASGRPMTIDELDCQVDIPSDDQFWQLDDPENAPVKMMTNPEGVVSLNKVIRSVQIMGRITRYVNRPRSRAAASASLTAPDEGFKELEKQLNDYYETVMPSIANIGISDDPTWPPTSSRNEGLKDRNTRRNVLLAFTIRVMYHANIVYLYRSVLTHAPGHARYFVETPFAASCLRRARASADAVIAMATRFPAKYRPFLPPAIIFFVASANIIHIHTMVSGDIGSAAAAAAKQKAEMGLNYFASVEPYWAVAGLHRGMMMELLRLASRAQEDGRIKLDESPFHEKIRLPVRTSMTELVPLWELAVQRELGALIEGQTPSSKIGLLQPFLTAMAMNDGSGDISNSPDSQTNNETPHVDDEDIIIPYDTPSMAGQETPQTETLVNCSFPSAITTSLSSFLPPPPPAMFDTIEDEEEDSSILPRRQ